MSESIQSYNDWNERNQGMAQLWIAPMLSFLRNNHKPRMKILDFGCGYFDLGMGLADLPVEVHGFDIHKAAINIAKKRCEPHANLHVHFEKESLQAEYFDLIIFNSVIQYFSGPNDLFEALNSCTQWLKKDPASRIVLSDVIPRHYSAPKDALENLLYATQKKHFWPMLSHLVKAAVFFRGNTILQLDKTDLENLLPKLHLSMQAADINLTPSKRRNTYFLSFLGTDSIPGEKEMTLRT